MSDRVPQTYANRKVLAEGIGGRESIKRLIGAWRPDYLRA